jgi:hypothetical protein
MAPIAFEYDTRAGQRGRGEGLAQPGGLPLSGLEPLIVFGGEYNDGLFAAAGHALRAVQAHIVEQFAEARLGLLQLPFLFGWLCTPFCQID